jgi:uncharacterized protein (DUF1330 family)
MSAYLLGMITVTDGAWAPGYGAGVTEIVERHGGRYLSRSGNIHVAEGEDADLTAIAVLEFPHVEAAKGFLADPDYAAHAAARRAGSVSRFFVIDDTDVLGTVPYLPKG